MSQYSKDPFHPRHQASNGMKMIPSTLVLTLCQEACKVFRWPVEDG